MAIDADLMKEAGMLPYEKILVGNMGNGERFETYAIEAPAGSKTISLNGATSYLGKIGDRLTIMSFATVDESEFDTYEPKVIVLDEKNEILFRK